VGLVQHKQSGELLAMKIMRKNVDDTKVGFGPNFKGESSHSSQQRTAPIAIQHIIQVHSFHALFLSHVCSPLLSFCLMLFFVLPSDGGVVG
jgi:hypothetical protein